MAYKDEYEVARLSTHGWQHALVPLADLDPRKEEAIGRRYRAGRYGARPILSRRLPDYLPYVA
jgi:hypothetical protein